MKNSLFSKISNIFGGSQKEPILPPQEDKNSITEIPTSTKDSLKIEKRQKY